MVESRHFTDYEMVAGMISAFSVPSLDLKIPLALLQGRESDLKYFLKDPWTPGLDYSAHLIRGFNYCQETI